tara:strand:+ start:31 stop:927 length:897 start_codon:yes stop_codon:yes gene_type:complete
MIDELIKAAILGGDYSFNQVQNFLEGSFCSNSWTYRPELRGATARIFTRDNGGKPELMKLFSRKTITKPIKLAAFQREVSAFRECRNYNLSGFPVYTSEGTVMGRFFLIMPYIEGNNLEHAMWEKDFSPEQVEKYLPKLAQDIGYAHVAGLVHRDLKPANLILGSDEIVVVDLGLMANYLKLRLNHLFTRRMVVGTPGSMSPEQIKLKPATPRSDVYSFGTILYHVYSGSNPFLEGAGFDALKILQRQKNPEKQLLPLADVSDVSVQMSDLTMRCLAVDPVKRPADGITLSRALEEIL